MNTPNIYLFHKKIGRDATFVLKHNNKYCLFSFEDNKCKEDLSICIFSADGNLHWTNLNNLNIPDKILSKKKNLLNVGISWLKNYAGSY